MPLSITLRDKDGVDVVFTEASHKQDTISFTAQGESLLDTKRLDISLRPNGATNRLVAKLSVPSVGQNPSTGIPGVQWTEVGSFDLTAVKVASADAANDFIAMFASLAASNTVKQLYTHAAWQ